MQIVIDIEESTYEFTKKHLSLFGSSEIARAVASGVVLPKCHGRLIDADRLKPMHSVVGIQKWVDDAPTIIEADKEEK